MTKNACSFNEPGSQIYKDAKTLKKIIVSKKFDIVHGKLKAKVGYVFIGNSYQFKLHYFFLIFYFIIVFLIGERDREVINLYQL